MKNVLHQIIKVIHALLWFPLSPLIGPDFLQRFFKRRRKSACAKQTPTRTGP